MRTAEIEARVQQRFEDLQKLIEELRGILDSESKLLALIKKELVAMKEKYSSPRRTQATSPA